MSRSIHIAVALAASVCSAAARRITVNEGLDLSSQPRGFPPVCDRAIVSDTCKSLGEGGAVSPAKVAEALGTTEDVATSFFACLRLPTDISCQQLCSKTVQGLRDERVGAGVQVPDSSELGWKDGAWSLDLRRGATRKLDLRRLDLMVASSRGFGDDEDDGEIVDSEVDVKLSPRDIAVQLAECFRIFPHVEGPEPTSATRRARPQMSPGGPRSSALLEASAMPEDAGAEGGSASALLEGAGAANGSSSESLEDEGETPPEDGEGAEEGPSSALLEEDSEDGAPRPQLFDPSKPHPKWAKIVAEAASQAYAFTRAAGFKVLDDKGKKDKDNSPAYKWFGFGGGLHDRANILRVLRSMRDVLSRLMVVLGGAQCKREGGLAHVFPKGKKKCSDQDIRRNEECRTDKNGLPLMYICEPFLKASEGQKFGILLHEASRMPFAKRKPQCLERRCQKPATFYDEALKLVEASKSKARKNPANYVYFILENGM